MSYAACLYHLRWRKKKVDKFIIPPTFYRKKDYSIVDENRSKPSTVPQIPKDNTVEIKSTQNNISSEKSGGANAAPVLKAPTASPLTGIPNTSEIKVSAFSLASIRAKKALEESSKGIIKEVLHLPTEAFTETEMLVYWNKYAQRLGDKGYKIMESLLLINDPKLNGTAITLELPNEGSKLDFEKELHGLLGYLKGHLHNHDITIEVIVNESIESRKSFNDQDRYNRLHEINPNIELLRTTFGLDLNA